VKAIKRESGFTLIELMVSLVITGVFLALVFSVQTRMQVSFQTQSQVSDLQQVVQAASEVLARDMRLAGLRVSPEFDTVACRPGPPNYNNACVGPGPVNTLRAVQVINDRDGFGADSIRLAYADPAAMTTLNASLPAGTPSASVNDASIFVAGDVVVLANPQSGIDPKTNNHIIIHHACIVQISQVDPFSGNLTFAPNGGPYNKANNPQCATLVADSAATPTQTVVARFMAPAYRIDPTRLEAGVLQRSPSGEFVPNDWEDLGIGFVNLQIASRYFESGDVNDRDNDGNAEIDWYSSEAQEEPDPTGTRPTPFLRQLNFTIVIRTHSEVSGIGTAETPTLLDPALPNYNRLGDFPAVTLPAAAPYQGNHVYRYATNLINLINLKIPIP